MQIIPGFALLSCAVILNWAVAVVLSAEELQDSVLPPRYSDFLESGPQGMSDEKMAVIESYLDGLLREPPWTNEESPLLFVEEPSPPAEEDQRMAMPWKRSRYYRRYPWKRQNDRNRGEDGRFLCNPSKEDVFQLLVALHDARAGNTRRTVNFCNRKRPASAIFTNIRFLGRRRK